MGIILVPSLLNFSVGVNEINSLICPATNNMFKNWAPDILSPYPRETSFSLFISVNGNSSLPVVQGTATTTNTIQQKRHRSSVLKTNVEFIYCYDSAVICQAIIILPSISVILLISLLLLVSDLNTTAQIILLNGVKSCQSVQQPPSFPQPAIFF